MMLVWEYVPPALHELGGGPYSLGRPWAYSGKKAKRGC